MNPFMQGTLEGLLFVVLVVAFINVLLWLMNKAKVQGEKLTCDHVWNAWHHSDYVLVGPMGRTVETVQQRECTKCGYMQRAELNLQKSVA